MKNNKGFSLIEILATIVIIGIVSTVGIVSVNSMINKSKQHFYESQKQQMVLAAQSYVQDNRNILPRNVGGMIKIKLSVLREKNYLKEDIIDQDKNVCDQDNSYVTVYKNNQTEYKYHGYLDCPACKKNGSVCYEDDGELKPVISIDFPDTNNQGNALFNKNKKISIIMKATNDDDHPTIKIASYSYKIYVDNVLKYDSGIKIDNKRITYTATEDIYKYVPGKIKVVATLTNTDGSTTSQTVVKNFKDTIKPQCGRVTYEGVNKMTTYDTQSGTLPKCGESGYKWIGIGSVPRNRVVWIVCNDVEGIGCAQHEFSQNFTSEGEDDNIVIKDKRSNSDTCKVKKCIDLTTSKITVNFYKATSGGAIDGNTFKTYTAESQHTLASYLKTEEHTEWLNYAKAPYGIIVKVKVDEPMSKIKSFTWKINPKEQSLSSVTDANTTIKTKSDLNSSNEVTYWIKDDGVRKQDITVVDKAENKVRYILTLRIDKTAPQMPSVSANKKSSKDNISSPNGTGYTFNDWTQNYIFTYATGGADRPDVSGFDHYEYTTTGTTANDKDKKGSYRNINAQGISYIKYRSCDKAGNCSGYTGNNTVKQDRTEPDITFTVTSSGGKHGDDYKNNVHIKVSCSDSYSGVKVFHIDGSNADNPSYYSRSSRGTLSKSAYCKDKVGNDSSKSGSYKVVKKGTSCSYCSCTSYNYYWYVCENGYSGALVNCKSPATYGGESCGPGNVGVAQKVSANLRAECIKGACTGCGPCWY